MSEDELSTTIIGPNGFPLVATEHALLRDEYSAWRDQNTGRHMSFAAYAKDVYFKDDVAKQPQPQPQPTRGRSGMYPDLSAAARSALPVLNKTVLAGLPVLNRFGAPSTTTREVPHEVWGMPALQTPTPTLHGGKAHRHDDGSKVHTMPALARIGLPSKYPNEVTTATSDSPVEVFQLLQDFNNRRSAGEDVVIEYKVTDTENDNAIVVEQVMEDMSIEVSIEGDGRRAYVKLDGLTFSYGVTSNLREDTTLFDAIANGEDFDGDSDSASASDGDDDAEDEDAKQLRGLVMLAIQGGFEMPLSFATTFDWVLSSDTYIEFKLHQAHAPAPVRRRSERLRRFAAPKAAIGMFALFPHRRHPHNPHPHAHAHPPPHHHHRRRPHRRHAGKGSGMMPTLARIGLPSKMPALARIGVPIPASVKNYRKYSNKVETATWSRPGEVFGLLRDFYTRKRAGEDVVIEYEVTPTRTNGMTIKEMSNDMNFRLTFEAESRRVYVTLGDITFVYGVTTQIRDDLDLFDEIGKSGDVDEDVGAENLAGLEELGDAMAFTGLAGPSFAVFVENADLDIDPQAEVEFTLRAARAPIGMPALVSARAPAPAPVVSVGGNSGAHVLTMARIGEMASKVRGHGMDAVYSPARAQIGAPTLPVGFPVTTAPVWKNQPGLFVTEVTDWKNVLELLSNWVAYSEADAKDESSVLTVECVDLSPKPKSREGKVFGVRSPINSLSLYVDATNADDTGRIYIAFGIQTRTTTSGEVEKKFRIPFYCSYDETSAEAFLARMKGKNTIALTFGGNANAYTFDDGDYAYTDDDDDDPVHAMLNALGRLNPHKVHYVSAWKIPNDSFSPDSTLAVRASLRLPNHTGPFVTDILTADPVDFTAMLRLVDRWAFYYSNSSNFAVVLTDYAGKTVAAPRIADGLTLSAMVDDSKTVKISITISRKTSFETMTTFPFIFHVKEGDTYARDLFALARAQRVVDGLACVTATFPSPMYDVIRKAMGGIYSKASSNDEADIRDIVKSSPSTRVGAFIVTAVRAKYVTVMSREPQKPSRELKSYDSAVGNSFATVCDSFAKDKATLARTVSGSRGAILAFAAELREAHAAVDSGSASRARGIRSSVLDTGALAAAAKAGPRDPKRAAFMAAASALSDHIVDDHSAAAAEIRSIGVSMGERLKRLRLKPDAFVFTLAEAWKRLGQQAVKDTMGLTDVDIAYRSGVQVFAPVKRRIKILERKNPLSSRSRALAWGAVGAAILSASVKALVANPKSAKFSAKLANVIYENISGFKEAAPSTQMAIGAIAVARQLKISDKVFAGLQTIVTKSIGKWDDENKTTQFAEASVVMFMGTFLEKKRELINLFMSAVAAVEILEEVTRVIAGVNATTRTQIIEKIEPAYDMLVADSTKE